MNEIEGNRHQNDESDNNNIYKLRDVQDNLKKQLEDIKKKIKIYENIIKDIGIRLK